MQLHPARILDAASDRQRKREPGIARWCARFSCNMGATRACRSEPIVENLVRNSRAAGLLAVLCLASMWFYVERVLIPYQRAESAAHGVPRGNLSDLYPRWLGARVLLLDHQNPYSSATTREIQRGYYGRELDPRRSEDPTDQQAFAYPVYVVFLLAPTIVLPFEAVRSGFTWVLVGVTLASVWLWLRAIGWNARPFSMSIASMLMLGCFPVAQGLKLQQLTLLTSFLIALGVALLVIDRRFWSGFVFAVATIKPQLVVPLLLCLLLWTISDWHRRQRFLWGFGLTMVALVGASEVVLPGWLHDFRQALSAYRRYVGGQSLLDQMLSPQVGHLFSAIALAVVILICWRFRRSEARSHEFQYMVVAALAVTLIVIPMFAPYNQVLLLPALLLIVREVRQLWHKSLMSRTAYCVTVGAIAWPWVACLGFMLGSIWLSPESLEHAWAIPLYTTLVIPVVLLVQLGSLVEVAWQSHEKTTTVAAPGTA